VPFDLVNGGVVQVEPPETPIIQVALPSGPAVVVQAPVPSTISEALPSSSTVVVPVAGPPGPQGPAGTGSDTVYEYQQTVPQSVWVVNHQFGRYPVAWSLFDTAARLCDEYSIEHVDVNTCRVSMDVATAGVIRLI
jgi:hypothetical protein